MHPNAKTNKQTRAYIQEAEKTVSELAMELGVSRATVRKWRERQFTDDKSHVVKQLRTRLNSDEEELIIFLRNLLNLSIDDMLIIMCKIFNVPISRAALGRLIQRKKKVYSSCNIYDKPKLKNDIENVFKLIVVRPKKSVNKCLYVILIELKSKMLSVNYLECDDVNNLMLALNDSVASLKAEKILFSQESHQSAYLFKFLQQVHIDPKRKLELYNETAITKLNEVCIIKILENIIQTHSDIKFSTVKSSVRAFQFIYNYKTQLRSLRMRTPREKTLLFD